MTVTTVTTAAKWYRPTLGQSGTIARRPTFPHSLPLPNRPREWLGPSAARHVIGNGHIKQSPTSERCRPRDFSPAMLHTVQDESRDRHEQDPSKGSSGARAGDAPPRPRSIRIVSKHLRCQAPPSAATCGFSTVGEVVVGPPTSCTAYAHVMHFGESSAALASLVRAVQWRWR